MKTKNNNNKKLIISILMFALVILLFWALFSNNNNKKEIDYSAFLTKLDNNEIAEVYVYDYNVYIRLAENGVDKDKFPKKYDYYCKYMSSQNLLEVLEKHNENVKTPENAIYKDGEPQTPENIIGYKGSVDYHTEWDEGSFLSDALPYISIAVVIIIGVMMYRTMSGNGGKGFTFGKSKAKLVVSSKVRFSDVAGAEEEKEELEELVQFLRNPQKFTELGARIPKGVLLVGPPGTGKTLLAKAVAGEAKVPFFSISGSDFVELYVGVGASRVRDLFAQAKNNAPCIIFIDEIDAVGRQRGAGLGGGNDEREQTLNQLLVEMDGFETNSGVIVLAATNRADVLDPALMRPGRFDRQVYVHIPDVKGREDIIKIHVRNKPLSEDVDIKRIARLTSGFAGADIENLLNEAALMAARDGRVKITMVDIQEGINKVIMGPKKVSRLITEDDKKITAVHESGHAVVAHVLPNCDTVQEISIIPRGNAGGYTLTLDEKDRCHMTKQKLLDTITMMLGGRAAEEVMLEDITTGASNDLERATSVARKMVAEWGMSEKFGLVSFGEGGEVFVGRDYQKTQAYSADVASKIDAEVKSIIDMAHEKAVKIIKEHAELIKKLQTILIDRETIYHDEFDLLFEGKDVAEVENIMDEKEKAKKEYQENAKKLAEKERAEKEDTSTLQTAEALLKANMISQKDYDKIKTEIETKKSQANAEQSQSKTEENNSSSKQNDGEKEDK